MDGRCARSGGRILPYLTLPALSTLEIQVDDFDEVVLDSFLLRSSPPLKKLSVHPVDLKGGTALLLSPSFMNLHLTELEIWHTHDFFVDLFFEDFGRDSRLLPQLQSLSFLGCRAEDDEADVLEILEVAAEPITARRNIIPGCAQLRSFRVLDGTRQGLIRYPEETLLPFIELKAAGMDVYIGTETISAFDYLEKFKLEREEMETILGLI
ncbi:hypothetical protein B0H19DRAFT_1147510 [Mycena capillaripes]|nr:hypothetical protein B0H19DRAFT_1147510 [Mycena capillaripes]